MGEVTQARHGAIAVIGFNNPPDGYLDSAMNAQLAEIVPHAAADPAVRVLVFRSEIPGVFIRHFSIVELEQMARAVRGMMFDQAPGMLLPGGPFELVTRTLDIMQKPSIAAINGTCMGGGLELAMACDVRYAQHGSYDIGLPEVNLGIMAGAGGTQRLPRLIGTARALEHMMAATMFSPARAAEIGLVNECVEDAVASAMALAERLSGQSPAALGYIKTLTRRALEVPLEEGLQLERALCFSLISSDFALDRMAEINAGKRDLRDV